MSTSSDPFHPGDSVHSEALVPLPPGAPDLSAARLRLLSRPVVASRHGAAGEASASARAPLVLAIDDSPAVRTIVEFSFARAGLRVIAFADGLEAIRALVEQRIAVPDLVLLDIGLPRLDGYAVAAVLRTNGAFANTPILMLSGRDGIVDRMRSRMVGAKTFVPKPFRPKELVALVCGFLGVAPSESPGLPSAIAARISDYASDTLAPHQGGNQGGNQGGE